MFLSRQCVRSKTKSANFNKEQGNQPFHIVTMISVIIPVNNGAYTIDGAIESAVMQADEIIVIDDGSTDNLEEVIAPYNIALIHNSGKHGPGSARNLGLKNANGDFVLFLDADDRLGENQIAILLEALLANRADMAWCATLKKSLGLVTIIYPEDWLESFLAGSCLLMHSMLFRREKVPLFSDEYHFEDRKWQSRMLVSGMKAVSTPKTCCLYNWGGPKERYKFFRDDNIRIRTRMMDWLTGNCPPRYAHANLYGCLQEVFQWGMKVPETSIHLLARAFTLLPGGFPDRRNPYYPGIIQRASRLWHGVQEHPLLEATLARLPKQGKRIRETEPYRSSVSPEMRKLAESLFPDVFAEYSNSMNAR